jgi:hypothetical protein
MSGAKAATRENRSVCDNAASQKIWMWNGDSLACVNHDERRRQAL